MYVRAIFKSTALAQSFSFLLFIFDMCIDVSTFKCISKNDLSMSFTLGLGAIWEEMHKTHNFSVYVMLNSIHITQLSMRFFVVVSSALNK